MINCVTTEHRIGIFGRIVDAITKKPVPGALVEIQSKAAVFNRKIQLAALRFREQWAAMMQRPDRTTTRPDGHFYFTDLADGKYTLRVTHPSAGRRYGSAEQSVEVSNDGRKRLAVEIALPPTTVKGKIVASGQKNGIAMAEVRVKGSGESTFSDVQGRYILSGLEPSKRNRTIMVLALGYGVTSREVNLSEPGAVETLDFSLVREGR